MKLARLFLQICVTGILLSCALAVAQDADTQKLIEIEKAFADDPTSGPKAAAVAKQYLYDGQLNHLTNFGRFRSSPKSKVLESYLVGSPWVFPSPDDLLDNKRDPSDPSKPDPSDPHIKRSQVSDLHADVYEDAALVTYRQTNTDTGHKDPALDSLYTFHSGCMDTFVKRNGQWYLIGTACAPNVPFPQAIWDAAKKARTQQLPPSAPHAAVQDADTQKLIEIEKAFADDPTSGPKATAVAKRYLYDGPLNHLTNFGRFRSSPKSTVLESYLVGRPWVFPSPDDLLDNKRDPSDPSKPDPSDPHIKRSEVSDLYVDVYVDTALVSYHQTNTDTGHKDPALDSLYTFHSGCMDAFVKRDGKWYLIGTACAPNIPFPQAIWDAAQKARTHPLGYLTPTEFRERCKSQPDGPECR